MNFRDLLQNRNVLIIIATVLIIIAVAFIGVSIVKNKGGSSNLSQQSEEANQFSKEDRQRIKGNVDLVTSDKVGKILEIEAVLARQHIKTERQADGSKIKLVLNNPTIAQRDKALLTIVQSGLADGNVGLEVFDQGDFTSTKDDKRIRLARAINGELSRLIRKIEPIENASVFISIAEPTIFQSMQKPTTATVQLVMPVGEKLSRDKVKAITNLLLGSVSGLELENISITDTNGNVYASMAAAEDSALEKVQENDEYMKAKVQAQLDKLLGKGNYVVTVSTYLRQVPMERSSIIYDPERNVVLNEQEFKENLGDNNNESGQVTNAVSLYLPSGLPQAANTNQNRNYSRVASEKQYGSTKTQVSEYLKPGMVEDISIAVTVENNAIPDMISIKELKNLIATAASPKVSAENVEIIFADSSRPALAGDKDIKLPAPEGSGNPWWIMVVIILIIVFIGWIILSARLSSAKAKQQQEIENLKNIASQQQNRLEEVNQQARVLLAQQGQLQESLQTIRETPQPQIAPIPVNTEIVDEMKQNLEEDDEEVAVQLKNWIESDN